MDLGLKGRKAILVGASHGIGLATAHALAAEGVDIALCSRSQGSVDAALAALATHGVALVGGAVDVTDAQAHSAWIASAAQRLGGCDIFIPFTSANTGVDDEDGWRAVFDADTLPLMRGVQAALPFLQKSDSGSIVTISSTAAVEEFMGPGAYNALKAATINYTAALAQKFAPDGIRVNCITPGPVEMEGRAWDQIKQGMPDFYDSMLKQIPLGRMGNGEEIAKAIAFVASPVCGYLTGANLVIDGGFTKRVQY
ncbi:SDR family oxidoreductase [Sphingobium sp. WCS2017Hpa-17]|uniref:SDR family NAD(P)-dependent oxidoreductase n=1 Tax=Sphingobium sp. WCS2017Hpa-17 TaxID=3073638 RepID=UPI00288B5BF4|nr:SDR family oxidoreductase [Sphingobium sp. WCS2017Hpa-17]